MKYYNNYYVLHEMDIYEESMGSKTIFHALPILMKLSGAKVIRNVGLDQDIVPCEDCPVEKEYRENWQGSLHDMVESAFERVAHPKADAP